MENKRPKQQLFTAYFNRDKDKFFLLFTDDRGSEATYYLNDEYDLGEKITELIQEYEREN